MHLTKRLAAASAVLLVSAGTALAATSPSGTFKGAVHWYNGGLHQKQVFDVTAKFKTGKLTSLTGKGNPGVIPYSKKKSSSMYCGAANVFNMTGMKIVQKKAPKGYQWEFAVVPKKNAAFGFHVILKGNWDSSSKAKAAIRFYQPKLPDKGDCDSGYLPVTLKKS